MLAGISCWTNSDLVIWDALTLMWRHCHDRSSLTHWGRVTHICVSKLTIIGSDNGLPPDRRQAIIWTNAGLLLIGPLGKKNFYEILIEILTFSFKKMRLKVSSAKRRPFCLGLNVLREKLDHPWDGTVWECCQRQITQAFTILQYQPIFKELINLIENTSILNHTPSLPASSYLRMCREKKEHRFVDAYTKKNTDFRSCTQKNPADLRMHTKNNPDLRMCTQNTDLRMRIHKKEHCYTFLVQSVCYNTKQNL